MFTGIIEALGSIADIQVRGGDSRVRVNTGVLDIADLKLGDSIAVNGVCLTAIELHKEGFSADVSGETMRRTTFGQLKQGSAVNLELALLPTSRLGGHLVSGHVDAVGKVLKREADARSVRFSLAAPEELAKYIAAKGSICIDGASLTVNTVSGAVFEVNIVPHTLKETIIDSYRVGTEVNLEVDQIARYLERLILGDKAAQPASEQGGISLRQLRDHGFA